MAGSVVMILASLSAVISGSSIIFLTFRASSGSVGKISWFCSISAIKAEISLSSAPTFRLYPSLSKPRTIGWTEVFFL